MKQERLANAHRVLVAAEIAEPVLDEISKQRQGLVPRDRQVEAVEPAGIFGKLALDHRQHAARDLVRREGLVGRNGRRPPAAE